MTSLSWPAQSAWPASSNWPAGTSWPSAYNLLADPTLLAVHEPDSGLADLAVNGVWGAFTTVGSAVPITGSFDGLPAYQLRPKSGTTGHYETILPAGATNLWKQPSTLFIAGRFGVASTVNGSMGGGNSGFYLAFDDATHVLVNGTNHVATTPYSFHVYEIIIQTAFSYISIDGGAYAQINPTAGGTFSGCALGARTGSTQTSDCDVLGIYVVEGQVSDQLRGAIYARIKARHPTTFTLPGAITSAAPALATANPSGLFNPATADAIVILGQSNAMNAATDNSSAAWIAGTYQLGADYVWRAGGDPAAGFNWLASNNQVDAVNATPFGGTGNLAGALANGLKTSTGRSQVIIGCAQSASAVVPGNGGSVTLSWERNMIRGNNLRDSLYWSSVYRAKEALRWGMTIRRIVWYQGNTEAINPTLAIRQAWPATVHAFIRQWCSDVGIPNPYDNLGSSTCKTVIMQLEPSTGPPASFTDFRTNIQPLIPQNANQVFVLNPSVGPYEADGQHLRSAPLDIIGAAIAAA